MGAMEEGGKVATSVVDSLKGTPMVLALLVINAVFIGFLTYVAHTMSKKNQADVIANQELIKQILNTCFDKHGQIDENRSVVFKEKP